MNTLSSSQPTLIFRPYPRFLWFLVLAYSMALALSNWYDAMLVRIFGIDVSPGALVFPLTFLLADVITEVYGYKHTRRAIWSAFLFNLIFIGYSQLVAHLPSPPYIQYHAAFNQLVNLSSRIVFASFVSYIVAEPLNAFVVAKMKQLTQGRYMAIRFVLSTVIASGFDSFIFSFIAFSHAITQSQVLLLARNIWLIKVGIEIIGLLFSIRLAKWLKKKEELDIYDYNTRFNLLSLEANYPQENNRYLKDAMRTRSNIT